MTGNPEVANPEVTLRSTFAVKRHRHGPALDCSPAPRYARIDQSAAH
jgi:hypothetical protein